VGDNLYDGDSDSCGNRALRSYVGDAGEIYSDHEMIGSAYAVDSLGRPSHGKILWRNSLFD